MKSIRLYHLLLGCFFTPALIFFVVSGAFQTFRLHKDAKNEPTGYRAPAFLKALGSIHKDQKLPGVTPGEGPSVPLQWFTILMSLGFLFTSVLGVVMSFRLLQPPWMVWVVLVAGTVIPALFLLV